MKKLIVIRQAKENDIDNLTQLISSYQTFYELSHHTDSIKTFFHERMKKNESIALLAFFEDLPDKAIGIAHLYPKFSTLSLKKIWILNDLYIDSNYRGNGVGQQLIDATLEFAKKDGAFKVELKTEHDNKPARILYEKYGFDQDKRIHYDYLL